MKSAPPLALGAGCLERRSFHAFGLLVYSEYFKSPTDAAAQKLSTSASGLSGAQSAVVLQNYVSR